jgi:hypothetical protein
MLFRGNFSVHLSGPIRALLATLISTCLLGLPGLLGAASAQGSSCLTWRTVRQSNGLVTVLTANNWGGGTACLVNHGGNANFTIASQSASYDGRVLSYADINVGCEGGYCTPESGLPIAVSAAAPTVTWSVRGRSSGGLWDDLIDSEFSANCSGLSDPRPEAGVDVYINGSRYRSVGLAGAGDREVTIDGVRWYYLRADDQGYLKTEFSAVRPVDKVSGLALAPFYRYAARHRDGIPSGDCLTDLGVGNEIWRDGAGLETTNVRFDIG